MNCKKCNNPISDDTKFCVKCGQKVISETKSVSEQKPRKKSIFTVIVSVAVFILAFGVVRYLTQEALSPSTNGNIQNSTYSTAELVTDTVKQVKASITLPNKVDTATTLVDVTAETNAIRYHYILSGVDTSSLSNAYLKNYLGSGLCQNKDTKNLLDQGINMEYSYVVENTTQRYFIIFNKADCL